jgi:hypothetical protein
MLCLDAESLSGGVQLSLIYLFNRMILAERFGSCPEKSDTPDELF